MAHNQDKSILSNVAETIMEMPIGYDAGGHTYYMYPPSLGTAMLIERLLGEEVGGSEKLSGLYNILKELRHNKELVVKLVAVCSFEKRSDALKKDLRDEMERNVRYADDNQLMQLLMLFSAWNKDVKEFTKYFGLDKEQEYIKRCMDVKGKDDYSLSFNGRSVYGKMIDVACERYGWTMDYVVWGISINNLQMLLADHITHVYLTKKERQQVNVPKRDGVVINMDSKNVDKKMLLSLMKK